jgi:hypothetical protein
MAMLFRRFGILVNNKVPGNDYLKKFIMLTMKPGVCPCGSVERSLTLSTFDIQDARV